MPPRKKANNVKKPTTGQSRGRGRRAAVREAPRGPAPAVETALAVEVDPSPSESEVDPAPRPTAASQMSIEAEVHQPAQFSSDSNDESPVTDAATSQKKRKRELVTADFSPEQEQEMVDWLQAPEQECILSKKHPNYVKRDLKEALWAQKAKEMGKTSAQLKKWYSNMRSRFGKLKQRPSGSGDNELTARDQWILNKFEFLRPHLIVQVKKRITVSMKAKVQARAAPAAVAGPTQSESDSDATDNHPPVLVAESDVDSTMSSRATDDVQSTRANIVELQKQLLSKLGSKAEKTPLQRQKDTFADFMKEVTYTFPPSMWLKFQSEVNNLLQKYQFQLQQQLTRQTQQQQTEFQRCYPPAPIPGPSSEQCPSVGWQPPPSQWPTQVHQPTSVWGSQDASWVHQQYQQQPPVRPVTFSSSTPQRQPPATSNQSKDTGNLTGLSSFSIGSYNSFSQLLGTNQADDNPDVNTPRPVVRTATPTHQQSE